MGWEHSNNIILIDIKAKKGGYMSKDNKMAVVCLVGAALLIILNVLYRLSFVNNYVALLFTILIFIIVFYINHKIKGR